MDLPSRGEPCKKNEINTSPPWFSIFHVNRTDRVVNSLCPLLREDDDAIYITITVAMGAGDATTLVATRIPSSNGLDDMTHTHCYCYRAHFSVTQHSNGRGEVICPLLHVPWANR
jgi:hypothetical protein